MGTDTTAVSKKEREWLLREKYHGNETGDFFLDLERLARGEPLAYVIGWVDFLGCRIELDAHPLIPRPETEWWAERAIEEIRSLNGNHRTRVLDLFSGSGCIGVAVARALPNADVVFGEKEPLLIPTIMRNIGRNGIPPERTAVLCTDVFSEIEGEFDAILANPPYIDPSYPERVQISVLEHEPHEALFANDGGLDLIDRFLSGAKEHLTTSGVLWCEFGEEQEEQVLAIADSLGYRSKLLLDQFEVPRVLRAERFS